MALSSCPTRWPDKIAEIAGEKTEWEVFSRMKLEQGGRLDKYYPLDDEAQKEYEAWLRKRSRHPRATCKACPGTDRYEGEFSHDSCGNEVCIMLAQSAPNGMFRTWRRSPSPLVGEGAGG